MEDSNTVDGYFSGAHHPSLPIIVLEDEAPVKTSMPARNSHDSDRPSLLSRLSFASERSTLPPMYESRRQSISSSYDVEAQPVVTEVRPLVSECRCGDSQCISCSMNEAPSYHSRRCGRGCMSRKERGCMHKSRRGYKFACTSFILIFLAWFILGGAIYNEEKHKLKDMDNHPWHCSKNMSEPYNQNFDIPMNNKENSFAFQQLVTYEQNPMYPECKINVDGVVLLQQAEVDDNLKDDEVRVELEYRVSDERILKEIDIEATFNGVIFKTSKFITQHPEIREACVFVKTVVKFPATSTPPQIQDLAIETETLNVVLKPSLSLYVNATAGIETVTGNIRSRMLAATNSKMRREINHSGVIAKDWLVQSITGDVHGTFAVGGSVRFETKSGDIDVGLLGAEPYQWSDIAQIDVQAVSISGDIAVHYVSKDDKLLPLQTVAIPYYSLFKTISGNIIGQYLMPTELSFETISGKIDAHIVAVNHDGKLPHSTLKTESKSGNTNLQFIPFDDARVVTEPKRLLHHKRAQSVIQWLDSSRRKIYSYLSEYCNDKHNKATGKPEISDLVLDPTDAFPGSTPVFQATHKTISGDITVHYPQFFEGLITADTLTGNLELSGKRLQIRKKVKTGPIGKSIEAVNGDEQAGGLITAHGISSSIELSFD